MVLLNLVRVGRFLPFLLEKADSKMTRNFFWNRMLVETGAPISILNSPTWNAIKTYLYQSKYSYKYESGRKLRSADNQLISMKECLI